MTARRNTNRRKRESQDARSGHPGMLAAGALLATLLLLTGCGLLGTGGADTTLVLSFSPRLVARTIEPTLSMEVHQYVVSGDGPGTAAFPAEQIAPDETFVRTSLVPGDWEITVEAYNEPTQENPDGILIGLAVETVSIASGELLTHTITVTPVQEPGELYLGVIWPAGVLTDPVLEAGLVPSGQDYDPSHDLDFAIDLDPGEDPDTGDPREGVGYENVAIDAGYYLLSLRLLDEGTTPVWGTVEAVRIVAGQPSEKDYILTTATNRGALELTIAPDLNNPFDINLSVTDNTEFTEGNEVEIEATAPGTDVDAWSWYLQGAPLADGSDGATITDGTSNTLLTLSGLEPAYYTVSVVGTTDGVISSTDVKIRVAPIPPPNGKIVYHTGGAGANIATVNADGTDKRVLTSGGYSDLYPEWSPDGTKIAFSSNRQGTSSIYVMNADGSSVQRVTDDGGNDRYPTWSPNGQEIAFESDRAGSSEVYSINVNGTDLSRRTTNSRSESRLDWSPGGTKIAYMSSDASGDRDVYVLNVADGSETAITSTPTDDFNPEFSPDGERIAFSGYRSGITNHKIFLVNAAGTGETVVNDDGQYYTYPTWSPTGTYIAFIANFDGPNDIYLMKADGTGIVNVTNDASSDFAPDWSNQ